MQHYTSKFITVHYGEWEGKKEKQCLKRRLFFTRKNNVVTSNGALYASAWNAFLPHNEQTEWKNCGKMKKFSPLFIMFVCCCIVTKSLFALSLVFFHCYSSTTTTRGEIIAVVKVFNNFWNYNHIERDVMICGNFTHLSSNFFFFHTLT